MDAAIPISLVFLIGLAIEASNPNSDILAYGFIVIAVLATLYKISDYRLIWDHLNDKRFPMRWSILLNFAMHIIIFTSIFIASQQLTNNNSYDIANPTNRVVDSIYHTMDVFTQVGAGEGSPKTSTTKVLGTVQLLDSYVMVAIGAALLIVPLLKR